MKRINRKWAGLVSVVFVATQCLSAYRDIARSVVEITQMVSSTHELPGEGEPHIGRVGESGLATESQADR